MKAILDAYTHLGQYVLNEVKDDTDTPIFKWFDIWTEQTEFMGEDGDNEEYSFDLPACFLDFIIPQTTTGGIIGQDMEVHFDFYCAFEILADTHIGAQNQNLATKPLVDLMHLHEMMEGYENAACGNLTRLDVVKYKTFSNLVVYRVRYRAYLRDSSATDKRRATQTVTVNAEPVIQKRPHSNPDNSGSGEKWFDLT